MAKKFGGKFKKTGNFGTKRQNQINQYGGMDKFKADTGITGDSSKKQIGQAFRSWVNERTAGGNPMREDNQSGINDPGVGTTTNVGQVTDQAGALGGQGSQMTNTGAGLVGQGAVAQSQFLPQVQQNVGQSQGIRDLFMSNMMGNQGVAYDPSQILNAQRQAFFDPLAEQRMQDVNTFFGEGSRAQEDLAKQLANTVTDFDELGVSGTSEASALGDVIGDFATARANALLNTGEQNRSELIDERNRLSGLAGQFSGQGAQGSLGFQQAVNQLLGTGGDIGQGISSTGANLANIGVNAQGASNQALLGAGELDLAGRNQEMDRQQAEQIMDKNFFQQFIDNLFNQRQFRRGNRVQDDLMSQLGGF